MVEIGTAPKGVRALDIYQNTKILYIQRCDASHDIFKGDTEISYIETP